MSVFENTSARFELLACYFTQTVPEAAAGQAADIHMFVHVKGQTSFCHGAAFSTVSN